MDREAYEGQLNKLRARIRALGDGGLTAVGQRAGLHASTVSRFVHGSTPTQWSVEALKRSVGECEQAAKAAKAEAKAKAEAESKAQASTKPKRAARGERLA